MGILYPTKDFSCVNYRRRILCDVYPRTKSTIATVNLNCHRCTMGGRWVISMVTEPPVLGLPEVNALVFLALVSSSPAQNGLS